MRRRYDDRFGEAAWLGHEWPLAEPPRAPISVDRIRDAILIVFLLALLCVLSTIAWNLSHTGRWG